MNDSNVYLVTGSEPSLVDAGTGMRHESLVREISKHIRPEEIRSIFLTHRHFDHIGGVSALLSIMDAKVYAQSEDAPAISMGDEVSTAAVHFGMKVPPVPVSPLEDGDVVKVGDANMRVIHTPGHTIGSMCLYSEDDAVLFSGDTFFVGGVGRWDLPTGSRTALSASLKRLEGVDFRYLYPGHGGIGPGNGKQELMIAQSYAGE
jgi:glyoxylase-like metal-dependent hydrolase (beta-lactamase superfamily II)